MRYTVCLEAGKVPASLWVGAAIQVNFDSEPATEVQDSLFLAADDIGILSGVVIVDRFRTISGLGWDVAEHVQRFRLSCQAVGIDVPEHEPLCQQAQACVKAHGAKFAPRDFSLVMLATPGRLSEEPPQPTLAFQCVPLPWRRLRHWYDKGQRLSISTHRNIPAACWSPQIKTRARVHYYLADRQARLETGDANGAAVLLDLDGFITETSTANVLIVEGSRVTSPVATKILDGISLKRTLRLAQQLGYSVATANITVDRAQQADAVLLCGSSGCLWPAAQLGERVFEEPNRQASYVRLAEAWKSELQLDYVQQAQCFGSS
jgi:branched-chain amino acid aminotransferase